MPPEGHAAEAYAVQGHDGMREAFEVSFFARLLPRLIEEAGGAGAVLDLGCGDGLAARLCGAELGRYCGVDLREPPGGIAGEMVKHDLRDGLGPVGREPFDVYLATFGVASHLAPSELRKLLGDIARHRRSGSLVALEGLGLHSLEWPGIWETRPGPARALAYRLGRVPSPVVPAGAGSPCTRRRGSSRCARSTGRCRPGPRRARGATGRDCLRSGGL